MKTKRILSVLLTLALAFGLLGTAASAADVNIQATLPTIVLGTTSATPTKVGFGGKQWAVIGYNGTGIASTSGKLTLLLANSTDYGTSPFNPVYDQPNSNHYSVSTLKTAMETVYGTLPAKEQAQVAGRDLAGGGALYSNPNTTGYDADKIAGPNVTGAKVWPLSAGEAAQLHSTVRATGSWWWLRSPGDNSTRAAGVYTDGTVYPIGSTVSIGDAVRPALLLNLASVLFVSDASGASAKSSVAVGGALSPAKPAGANLKFTMKDSSLALGGVTATSRSGNTLNFSYSGATTGKTLSAVVLRDGAVKYYGKLVASTSASGTASVTLPGDFATATDTVQIFVEECNGDNFSDFASAYKQLAVTPALTSGSVSRTSDTAATINFTANMEGTAYYAVLDSGAAAPSAALVKSGGTSLSIVTAGAVTGKPVTLTAGAKDIYVVLEALGGLLSAPLKISVAAFGGGGGTDPGANYIKLWGKTTKYLSNFGNWLLVIFCFGWIWMAF